jgi:hypothetical protein
MKISLGISGFSPVFRPTNSQKPRMPSPPPLHEIEMMILILLSTGEDVTMMASMVKLKAGRLSRQVTDGCLQFFGGMGFTNEVRGHP